MRQCVLSCIIVWRIRHFESAVGELWYSPGFSASFLGAVLVLAKEKPLLTINRLADTLNNSDLGKKRLARLGQAAAMGLPTRCR